MKASALLVLAFCFIVSARAESPLEDKRRPVATTQALTPEEAVM